jgi:hypothetical protein
MGEASSYTLRAANKLSDTWLLSGVGTVAPFLEEDFPEVELLLEIGGVF